MTYREEAIEIIKIAANDLLENAEKLIPETEAIKNIDVVVHIPTLTDDPECIPTVKVVTDAYVRPVAMKKIWDVIHSK